VRLLSEGVSEEQISATEQATNELIEHAVQSARSAPYPDPALKATEYRP
jgi:TPP-dependent pyruvate/acetoin dehydrogenase alpha subunit